MKHLRIPLLGLVIVMLTLSLRPGTQRVPAHAQLTKPATNAVAMAFPEKDLRPIVASTLSPEPFRAQTDPSGHWRNPAKPVEPVFPATFSEPVRVRCGEADVSARPLNANSSAAKIEADGSLVYENAFDGADVHYRCSAYKTEEFIVVREAASQRTFAWDLEIHGLKPRLTPAHTIELCDDAGVPRLRINAPVGKDANGRVLREGSEISYAIDGSRLTMTAKMEGCALPVVIDPTWSSTGLMSANRSAHTGTTLNDGRVLIVGGRNGGLGYTSCDIFDPATNTFSATASTSTPHTSHAAVALSDGRVLVTGGWDFSSQTSGAAFDASEIFNPATAQWTTVAPMQSTRRMHTLSLLSDGRVLAAGGYNSSGNLSTAELYDGNGWTNANPMGTTHYLHQAINLQDGTILIIGNDVSNPRVTEVYNPGTGTWTTTGPLHTDAIYRGNTRLGDGRVITCGGGLPNNEYSAVCEIYDPTSMTWSPTTSLNVARSNGKNCAVTVGNFAVVIGGDAAADTNPEIFNPLTAVWKKTPAIPKLRFEATTNVLNNGQVLVAGGFGTSGGDAAIVFDPFANTPPTLTASVSPMATVNVGTPFAFSANGSDFDGDALTYSWDFGDGTSSADQNPSHAYNVAGTYTVTVTVTDAPGKTAAATLIVTVGRAPQARFTTSDVAGFVGQPLTFDASLSTDKENDIAAYQWEFGDGSPAGSKQVLSKIYDTAAAYAVTLTVIDGQGLKSSATRNVVILPADQIGIFNSSISYKVRFDRNKENADTLTLTADVNVGDVTVGAGTNVAIEIAGQRFEGTLDAKLRDKSATEQWTVKANTRKQSAGEVSLKFTVKKANLGVGFNQAGAVPGGDPSDPVDVSIPVRLEIAGRIFEVSIDSSFKFGNSGKKATGEGDGP